jgi:hypothetical protein
VRFEKLAETLLKNEMFVNKFQNNNLLVEVMHLVAMFLSDKLDKVDKKVEVLEDSSKQSDQNLKEVFIKLVKK